MGVTKGVKMTVPSAELCQDIRQMILEQFAPGFTKPFTDDDNLSDVGALDSMLIVEVVLTLEKKFNVHIDAGDITPDNFGTIRSIAAYISDRLAAP